MAGTLRAGGDAGKELEGARGGVGDGRKGEWGMGGREDGSVGGKMFLRGETVKRRIGETGKGPPKSVIAS
jgi:hypothetical protein